MDAFLYFKDRMSYDSKTKTALSVRDGFLEYAGYEIGKEPSDKIFKVYRSPATISNVASLMKDIPLTDEHVDLDRPVSDVKGYVKEATMIDLMDESTNSKLAIKNAIEVSDQVGQILSSGKRELSLGYTGSLVEYDGDEYDFEQRDIIPHHLAIVDQGRCGSMCSFIDRKIKDNETMNKYTKMFLDEKGNPNMQEIVDMTLALPEALKVMPLRDLQKIAPKLQEIVVKAGMATPEQEAEAEEAMTEDDEAQVEDAEKVVDEEAETTDGEAMEAKDEEEVKDEEKVAIKVSAEFKDALEKAVKSRVEEHTAVIVKAQDFLDESYDYKGKDTKQIMRDCLGSMYGSQKFEDAELPVAFKILKPQATNYDNFADKKDDAFEALKNKDYA